MKIGISACLLGKCCTYKGGHHLIETLQGIDNVEFVMVCPEVMGGLAIPRDPCEIISQDPLKIVSIKGEDKTEAYRQGASKALQVFDDNQIKVALLKYKSPSCSCDGVYDGTFSGQLVEGKGVFAHLCQQKDIVTFHEKQLAEFFDYIEKNR